LSLFVSRQKVKEIGLGNENMMASANEFYLYRLVSPPTETERIFVPNSAVSPAKSYSVHAFALGRGGWWGHQPLGKLIQAQPLGCPHRPHKQGVQRRGLRSVKQQKLPGCRESDSQVFDISCC